MNHPRLRHLLALVLAAGIAGAHATGSKDAEPAPLLSSKVYLEISPAGRDDLEALFRALEESLAADEPQAEPVVIILQGPEALPFIRRNYLNNKDIVDRAARLEAFHRIDLRMCEFWMRENGFDEDDLLPFVDTVPLAPAEVERLEKDGYISFSPSMDRSGPL